MIPSIVLLVLLSVVATVLGKEAARARRVLRWINVSRIVVWALIVVVVISLVQSLFGGTPVLEDFWYGFQEFWGHLTSDELNEDPYDPSYPYHPSDPDDPYFSDGG